MAKRENSGPATFRAEVGTADLLRALCKVVPVLERRNTAPVLGLVELAMGFGTMAIQGTDLDIEVRAEIEANGEGALCVPGERLLKFVKAVAHIERLRLEADAEGVVTVSAAEFACTMHSLPAADMPRMQVGSSVWKAHLAEGVFRFLVGGVAHAICTEETRYYLCGVCLEVLDGRLVSAATDGHRLATRDSALSVPTENHPAVIVPRKAVVIATMLAGPGEATLVILRGHEGDKAAFCEVVAGGVRLRSKLIDGKYPDWRRVVPAASNTVIEVETKQLRRALKATAVNADGWRHRATKISSAKDGICLSSRSPDFGDARVQMACPMADGLPTFGVNGRYLDEIAQTLERVGSKTMRLHVTDNGSPVRIVPDEAIAGVLNVLMPMRV